MTELSLLVGMEDNEFQKCLIRGLPEQLKWHVVGFNPKTVEETVQRILLGDATLQWSTKKNEINAVEAKDWKMAEMLEKCPQGWMHWSLIEEGPIILPQLVTSESTKRQQ